MNNKLKISLVAETYRERFEAYAKLFAEDPRGAMVGFNNCLFEAKKINMSLVEELPQLFLDCLESANQSIISGVAV